MGTMNQRICSAVQEQFEARSRKKRKKGSEQRGGKGPREKERERERESDGAHVERGPLPARRQCKCSIGAHRSGLIATVKGLTKFVQVCR